MTENQESTISGVDDAQLRLIRYLKYLNLLNKKDREGLRSILTMVNHFDIDPDRKQVRSQFELAEEMLDFGIYKKVIEYAKQLIDDSELLKLFLEIEIEETGDVRLALVRDYMQSISKLLIYHPDATLSDLLLFFRKADPETRYFIVADHRNQSLIGIISVNDFTRKLEEIKKIERSTPVTDLPFFNDDPKIILDSDQMEYAQNLFAEAEKAGRKITKLLVVTENKRPVGLLAEPDLVRWETSII